MTKTKEDPVTETETEIVTETSLWELLVKVEIGNNDMQRAALLADLEAKDGSTIRRRKDMAEGIMTLEMAGVAVDFPDSQAPRITLDNWCAAARRMIMSGNLPA